MTRLWPVPGHGTSSPFGPRGTGMHRGIDIAAPLGTPIVAPVAGVVMQGRDRAPGSVTGFGSWVWLRADTGEDLVFGHVSHRSIRVSAGDRVAAGDRLADVGSEGQSTGPHLHFEVHPGNWAAGSQVDPAPWLAAGTDTKTGTSMEGAIVGRTILDYSAGIPSPRAIKDAGHSGVIRYVSPPREGWMAGKPLRREEADALLAAGLTIASVWQHGKRDPARGREGGLADAREAERIHLAAGGDPRAPIFFAIDWDISLHEWNNQAAPYLRAAAEVLGKDRVGAYCKRLAAHWAIEDDVVGHCRDGSGKRLIWQPNTWMGRLGDGSPAPLGTVHPQACLFQRLLSPRDDIRVDGVGVDVNDVLAADHGQWWHEARKPAPVAKPAPAPGPPPPRPQPGWRGDPVFLPEVLRAWGVRVVEYEAWRDRGHGDFGSIWGVVAHHTGAPTPDRTPPSVIAHGTSALRGLLSQVHLAKDGTATLCGAGIAWHAGRGSWPGLPTNNANALTIGIEAVNSGSEPWPPEQLRAYKLVCAAILWFLGHDSSRLIAHREWARVQGKIDPAGIDMNAFRRDVQHLIDNPPFAREDTKEPPMAGSPGSDPLDELTRMRESLIAPPEGQRPFRATMGDYIRLIDAAAYRIERATERMESTLERIERAQEGNDDGNQ